MWYPPPVMVPIYLEPSSRAHAEASNAIMFPVVTVDQHVYLARNEVVGHRVSHQDGRKFLLNKFVFDLVKISHCLELTHPKLLGWYLSLPAEDRKLIQEEGGLAHFLQRHPALEVTRDIVHLKQQIVGSYLAHSATDMASNLNRRATLYGASQCLNCGTSCARGAKKCRCCNTHVLNTEGNVCISEEEKTLRLLPNNVKEELNLIKAEELAQKLDCRRSTSNNLTVPRSNSSNNYQKECQPRRNSKIQPHCQLWKGRQWNDGKDTMVCEDPSAQASFSLDMELEMQCHAQSSSQDTNADICDLDQETPPEYYSFNSTTPEHLSGQLSDASLIGTKGITEASVENSVPSGFENSAPPDSASYFSDASECNDLTDCQDLRNEDDLERESKMECHATETSLNSFVKPCRDASTCTDTLTNCDQERQTAQRSTSEKFTITDVYMSDLDALSEEFGVLKNMERELKHLKHTMARSSSGGQGRECLKSCCGCSDVQRAQWAELRLLSLQYVMCQQHCWRRYYTSPLGESALYRAGELSGEMSRTLRSLEEDYLEMKRKILAGVPLDDLKPLSVDTQGITTGTCYSPSLICDECLGDVPRQEPSHNAGGVEGQSDQTDEVFKKEPADGELVGKNLASLQLECTSSKRSGAVSGLSQKQRTFSDTKSGTLKDQNSTEAWFDAKEELGSDCQSCKEDSCTEQGARGDLEGERNQSLLRVTNVPSSVNECDLLRWFEKYNTSRVCISTFNDNRVALVSVRSPSDAEAAVREVNGQSIQGYTFQVEHVDKHSAHGQGPIKKSCAELSPAGHKVKSAGDEQNTQSLKINFQTSKPLQCSLDKLTNICDTPTASGTYVPQRFGSMGSFDTIMACLLERHPQVGRRRIISALLELRMKHQGILSGLPLQEIVDMTSDLLTQ